MAIAAPLFGATEKRIDPRPEGAQDRSVTMDVKDADVRDVLKDMQRQCGVRNLVVDPDVSGKATFYFRHVSCPNAFDVVLATFRLRAEVDGRSLMAIEKNR
ncbi:MAG TPA: hypothetical protein VKH35_14185 [Thermoanaerobaculia bacterium]|nr:hypothetical protein [Thermoanaerobaculia bacterium]